MQFLAKFGLVLSLSLGLIACNQDQKTIMIVNMGDSYTSGDGTKLETETWEDVAIGELQSSLQCHRTKYNRTHLAVERLQQKNYQIEYVDVSCSGATIFNGVLGPFVGHPVNGKTLLPLDSQIDQVKAEIERINPDQIILVLSVGGNDIGFAAVVAACSFQAFEGLNPWHNCEKLESLKNNLKNGLRTNTALIGLELLPAAYERLAQKIDQQIKPDHVLITEYPDPTRDSSGNFCGGCPPHWIKTVDHWLGKETHIKECIKDEDFEPKKLALQDLELIKAGGDFMFSWGVIPRLELIKFSLQYISSSEMEFAYQEVLTPLNEILTQAASDHNWILVDSLEEISRPHGVCSDDSWFNNFQDSWQHQQNITGVLHPNQKAHHAFSQVLEMAIENLIK